MSASNSSEAAETHEWLARAYWVAGCTLVHLRYSDAAFQAVRNAISHADRSDDAFLAATLRGSLAWQLLVSGRFRESESLCLSAASGNEPSGSVALPHLSAYGSLVLTAATAAARDQRPARAGELVSTSAEVADRMGGDRDDYQTALMSRGRRDTASITGRPSARITRSRTQTSASSAMSSTSACSPCVEWVPEEDVRPPYRALGDGEVQT